MGSAEGSVAQTAGTLVADAISVGTGGGKLNFNHTADQFASYQFDVDLHTVFASTLVVNHIAGHTTYSGDALTYTSSSRPELSITGGTFVVTGQFGADYVWVSGNEAGRGNLVVSGDSALLEVVDTLEIGWPYLGSLLIEDGGQVLANAVSAEGDFPAMPDAFNTIAVTGSGSLLQVSGGSLDVANYGRGMLTISNTGLVIVREGHKDADPLGVVDLALGDGSSGIINVGAGEGEGEGATAPGTLVAARVEFGYGQASLIFNHTAVESDNYTFDADLVLYQTSGANPRIRYPGSNFIKHLNGHTRYTGQGMTAEKAFNGTITISGGTLIVEGSLGGTFIVEGGTLGGGQTLDPLAGLLGDVFVETGGTYAPGQYIGTSRPHNVTFNPGSIYEVEINAHGENDLIDAGGVVEINGGRVIALGESGADDWGIDTFLTVKGSPFTIIKAAGGINVLSEFEVVDTLMLGFELFYFDQSVEMTADMLAEFNDFAQTTRQRAVVNALDSLIAPSPLLRELLFFDDPDELRAAMDVLSGEIFATLGGIMIAADQRRMDVLLRNIGWLDSGQGDDGSGTYGLALGGAKEISTRWWVSAFGDRTSGNREEGLYATESELAGWLIGVEKEVGPALLLGLAGGYSGSDSELDALSSKADVKSWSLGSYGHGRHGAVSYTVAGFYTWHEIQTDRLVQFGNISDRLTADYSAGSLQVLMDAGYDLPLDTGFQMQPFASYGHVAHHHDGFRETGGAAALTGASDTINAGYTTLGLRAKKRVGQMHFNAMAGWRRGFGDLDPVSNFSLETGGAFAMRGAPISDEAFLVELGTGIAVSDAMHFFASYDGQFSETIQSNGLSAQLRVKF